MSRTAGPSARPRHRPLRRPCSRDRRARRPRASARSARHRRRAPSRPARPSEGHPPRAAARSPGRPHRHSGEAGRCRPWDPWPSFDVDADLSARLPRETINHRKPEAGSLSERFRREERIERPRHHGGAHARPRVADAEREILPGRQVAVAGHSVVHPAIAGLDGQEPASRHRVTRIDAEVQEGVFELVGVHEGGPKPDHADHLDRDLRSDGPPAPCRPCRAPGD